MKTVKPESLINHTTCDRQRFVNLSNRAGVVKLTPFDEEARTEFLRFLQKHEIVIYPYDQVWDFMNEKVTELTNKLSWWRRKWHGEKFVWRLAPATLKDCGEYGHSDLYDKPIPVHAVEKMALIRERFHDRVKFYVTDYDIKRPDPFLIVIFQRQKFAVDKWDEPDFKLK